jgi:glycosyltransferase involved in cell wall biosynthesis
MICQTPPRSRISVNRKAIVAIPVKNEEARLNACLAALARQWVAPDHILLLLNNCTDRTVEIARAAAAQNPRLVISEVELAGPHATAGEARRLALAAAAEIAGPQGVIMTTDADCRPDESWAAKNLCEIARGADVVCGAARIMAGPEHPGLHFDLAREAMYAELLDEIAALVDPDPADPWPRHQHHSGASIAMTAQILHAAGGAPRVPSGEDRALIERFRLFDARIRHAPDISVAVSGRLNGRAKGGMAEALSRRVLRPDEETDAALEPAVDAYRRVLARARLRGLGNNKRAAESLARDLLIDPEAMAVAQQAGTFGAAWAIVEQLSPVLHRRRVKFVNLARETRQAMAIRDSVESERPESRADLQRGGRLHAE